MGTVLLATDGSEYAERAAERAVDVARERDATLHVLCVVDQRVHSEPGLGTEELATIAAEDRGHRCVAEAATMAAGAGVPVQGDVRHGVPDRLISSYADEIDADVVVVGEHGDHADHMGGVARRLTEESSREVLVVPMEE